MLKFLLFLSLLFPSLLCFAQPSLRYGAREPTIDRDSLRIGDSFSVIYTVVNEGDAPYDDTVFTFLSSDKAAPGDSISDNGTIVSIKGGDSVTVIAGFFTSDSIFNPGEAAIVVVWPAGGGTESLINKLGKRTLKKSVYIEPLWVNPLPGPLNRVRIYPNPVRSSLTLEVSPGPLAIEKITVRDISGRFIAEPVLRNGQADLSSLSEGLYILSIRFTDGSESVFRLVKQ